MGPTAASDGVGARPAVARQARVDEHEDWQARRAAQQVAGEGRMEPEARLGLTEEGVPPRGNRCRRTCHS
eukprot:COSAG01_NODE_400_length_17542_cov_19.747005_12_plen_70_part_00